MVKPRYVLTVTSQVVLTLPIQGGNQAVTYGGNTSQSQTGGPPYENWDGGKSSVFSIPGEIFLFLLMAFPACDS